MLETSHRRCLVEVPKVKAGGIIRNDGLAKIGIMSAPDRPGLAAAVLRTLGEEGINTEFVVQCIDLSDHSHVILCVAEDDLDAALAALKPVKTKVKAEAIISQRKMTLLSVFGPDFRERPSIAAKVFEALASVGINIMAISTSISTVSCLVDGDMVDNAIVALREQFEVP